MADKETPSTEEELRQEPCICVKCGIEIPVRKPGICVDKRCPSCGAALSSKDEAPDKPVDRPR